MARPAPFGALVRLLDPGAPVLVQAHDYPDIDAVSSAWALAELLRRRGLRAGCCYRGRSRSRSLARLVAELGIEVWSSAPEGEEARIVVVDGSPSNGNVTLFPGRLTGVVDHHHPAGEARAPSVDIRPGLASCAAMVYGYWREAGEEPPRPVATALLAGIQSDTDFLSRRSSPEDFRAYTELFGRGDYELASRIVRTVLDLRELGLAARALAEARVGGGLLYASLAGPCAPETLAVLADFALRAEELRAAVVAGRDEEGLRLSVRSKAPGLSAFDLVRRALEGLGCGGGHSHSAGGHVPAASDPGDDAMRDRFFAAAEAAATTE